MNGLLRGLSTSPKWRIYRFYIVSWLALLWLGYIFFTAQYVTQRLERVSDYSALTLGVIAPVLVDEIQASKTTLIQPTLDATVASPFIAALSIALPSGEVWWQSKSSPQPLSAPSWLNTWVKTQLPELQRPLAVNGVLLGTLHLSYETEALANDLWHWLWTSWLFTAVLACLGVLLGLVPLSRALAKMSALGQQAQVTLNAISEGVLTCNAAFQLISINPAAQRLLGLGDSDRLALLGQDLRTLLPKLFLDYEVSSNWVSRGYIFVRKDGEQVRLETGLADARDGAMPESDVHAVCKVLTLRDASHAHDLANAQQAELLEHKNAMAGMKKVADSLPLLMNSRPEHDALSGGEELNYLTAWVLAVVADREWSRQALEHQKYALDQHAIVVTCNMEGVLSYANDRYCCISGFERDALLGQKPRLHSGTDTTRHFYSEVLDTISNGNIWQGKLQGQNRQGHPFWVNATVVPLYNEFLVQDRYMLMGTDITEDQQNKALLSEQLGLMEALLEAIPTAIYFKDSLGRYSVINSAFAKLFGLSRPQVLGKTAQDIVPSLFAQLMVEKDQSLQVRGGVQVFETSYIHPLTGRLSDFHYSKALTTNEQGQITGIVGAIEDVTERKQNLRQLEEATRLAEAANRAKSNFLANMSHEIRTPMNGVIGMTDLALELALDPAQRDYLSLAASSAQALMVVINDILDISKIEANRVDIESIDFSLSDVIQHSLKPVEAMARKKGLAFVLTQNPDLPDHVMGDPTRLRQVLLNLYDNAVKFTPAGHVAVHVGGAPVVGGGFDLTVAVSDTGIGIAPEQQSTVFDIFSQADASTTRQYGGSGLGLTISAKLAVLMGGGIALDSVPGQGSTFTLRLRLRLGMPQGVHHPAVMLAPARTQATGVVPQRPSVFQVMLVEDNPVNQILCGTILKKLGHTVALANHGQEALDLFAQQPWDVILMDMQMPVMDGLEATRAIRALELPGQHTPIVAMTANAMETDRQLCLEAGMDDYLSKPFKFAHLQAILEKAVSRNFPSEA